MSSEYELWLRDVGVVVDAIEIGGEETLFILQQHFLAYPHAALFSLKNGETLLHLVAKSSGKNKNQMVKEVLKKGPNSLQKNFEGKRAIDMVPSFPLSNVQIQSNLRHYDLQFRKFEILRFIHEEREPRSYLSWLPAHLFSSLRETYFSPTPSLSYGLYEEQRPNFEEEWLSSICDLQSQQIDYLIQVLEKERINSRVLMERVRDLEGKKLS